MIELILCEGRGSRWFTKKGMQVVGVDHLQTSLRIAGSKATDYIRFTEEFDYVANLFTSFGYFDKNEENELVIRNMNSALQKDGTLLLDYLNPNYLKKNLIPFSRERRDGLDIL